MQVPKPACSFALSSHAPNIDIAVTSFIEKVQDQAFSKMPLALLWGVLSARSNAKFYVLLTKIIE